MDLSEHWPVGLFWTKTLQAIGHYIWRVGISSFRTNDALDNSPFGPKSLRPRPFGPMTDYSDHYPSNYWPIGPMALRNINHSYKWPLGLLVIWTNDHLEYVTFGTGELDVCCSGNARMYWPILPIVLVMKTLLDVDSFYWDVGKRGDCQKQYFSWNSLNLNNQYISSMSILVVIITIIIVVVINITIMEECCVKSRHQHVPVITFHSIHLFLSLIHASGNEVVQEDIRKISWYSCRCRIFSSASLPRWAQCCICLSFFQN